MTGKVLVTGCNGFVGRALAGRLVETGYEVWGADRVEAHDAIDARGVFIGDLCDAAFVEDILARSTPSYVVHLAGQASVRQSFDDPVRTLSDNTRPALNILNALRVRGSRTRVLLVGSADEYGIVDESLLPLAESVPVNPESPYALAKAIQNQYGRMFANLYGVDAVMTRSFNHTGPGQRDTFVLPSFARQVAAIRRGTRDRVIEVGNLDVKRDFLDVGDVCDAYVALMTKGHTGETYNVCSGQSYRISDMLRQLCDIAQVDVTIRVDEARLRPVDMPDLRGDPGKMAAHTGWKAGRPVDETLRSLLEYWDKEDA